MNRELLQNILLVVFGLALILVGVVVFMQSQEISNVSSRIDVMSQSMMQTSDKMDAAMMKMEEMNEKMEEDRMMMEEKMMEQVLVLSSDVSLAAWPDSWTVDRDSEGIWRFQDGDGEAVAFANCDMADTGYEVWDITETDRDYQREDKNYRALKWIGEPTEGEPAGGWLAVVFAGLNAEGADEFRESCGIHFEVSNPPTSQELANVDMIFEGLQ